MKLRFLAGRCNRRTAMTCYAFTVVLLLTTLIGIWLYDYTDKQMRAALLDQSRLIAQSINIDSVKSLTGTSADLTNPQYLKLREQLTPMRQAETSYRYVYLMGRNSEGEIYFVLDADPDDPAAPGTIYAEASQEFRDVFDSAEAFVEGPLPDQWGVWVSATIPILDPANGHVLAVLGMDSDAANWHWRVILKMAWPFGGAFISLCCLAIVIILMRREARSSKPVLTRLLLLLTVGLVTLVAGTILLLLLYYNRGTDSSGRQKMEDAADYFSALIADRCQSVAALEMALAQDPVLQEKLAAQDANALAQRYTPLYQKLRSDLGISWVDFYNHENKQIVSLSTALHQDRNIAAAATQDTPPLKETTFGFEVSDRGGVAIQTTTPVRVRDVTVGYLKIGQRAEDLLKRVREASGLETVLLLNKDPLNRALWEKNHTRERNADEWLRFHNFVIEYSSILLQSNADAALHRAAGYLGTVPGDTWLDGRCWQMLSYPLNGPKGGNIGGVVFLHDITAAKMEHRRILLFAIAAGAITLSLLWGGMYWALRRTDLQIRRQIQMIRDGEQRYYVLFSDSPDGYLIISDMTITACNQAACRTFRCQASDIVGKKLGAFSPPMQPDGRSSIEEMARRYQQALLGDQHFEWRSKRPDGTEFWCEIATSMILLHGKKMLFISLRDVTERKHAQECLLQSEHMAAIGLFAAGIAHNFNNLHAGILGHLQLLQRREQLSEYGQKKLSMVLDTMGRAINLTENILLLTGASSHECLRQSLADVLQDTVELIREEFENDDIRFDLQLDSQAAAYCNGGEIRHVILNLLVNARHAMIDCAHKVITVSCGVDGDFAWFTIADNGCGIPQESMGKIFTPFYSTKGVYAPPGSSFAKVEGTGLGLSSSKAIIDNHHGDILVDSTVGTGTSFTIRLHRKQETL